MMYLFIFLVGFFSGISLMSLLLISRGDDDEHSN